MTAKTRKPDSKLHASFVEALKSAWPSIARPEQLPPPGKYTTWVFSGGRGAGKTRSGAEWVIDRVQSGAGSRIHLIAPTASAVRDVMIEGESGILATAPSHLRPVYQPSLRKLTFPNGEQALLFSADEPDRLRGPQCDTLWIDELCAMRTAQEVLDTAMLGLRLGKDPRCLITTTPRPLKCFKVLLAREGQDVVVTRSSSYANRDNLAPAFFDSIIARYAGTRLARQEIEAELLTDIPGALWSLERIEDLRVARAPDRFVRVVVAIDPAVTFGPDSDECGIVVVGLAADGICYVIDDLSGRFPPLEWAQRAIAAYRQYYADRIIAEVNQGGDLVETTLRSVDAAIPLRKVYAARGKQARHEPVSALYEQSRVRHVGVLAALEDQMTSYDGTRSGSSPDRLDALCWAIHELALGTPPGGFIQETALLPPPRKDEPAAPREPVEMPQLVDAVFAYACAAVDGEPDVLGTVYLALSAFNFCNPPLVILDWDLTVIEASTPDTWFPAVSKRAGELIRATRARSRRGGVAIDPQGVGEVLHAHGRVRGSLASLITDQGVLELDLSKRALAASGYVNTGHVQISRDAYDKVQTFRGVTHNHLLHQIAAFDVKADKPQVGVLLAAFSNGVIEAFKHTSMRHRAV